VILLPEEIIRNYFNRQPFSDNKLSIFEHDCKDKGCELKGNFEDYIILNGDNIKRCLKINQKSVDRIIFTKKASNNKLVFFVSYLEVRRDILMSLKKFDILESIF